MGKMGRKYGVNLVIDAIVVCYISPPRYTFLVNQKFMHWIAATADTKNTNA